MFRVSYRLALCVRFVTCCSVYIVGIQFYRTLYYSLARVLDFTVKSVDIGTPRSAFDNEWITVKCCNRFLELSVERLLVIGCRLQLFSLLVLVEVCFSRFRWAVLICLVLVFAQLIK